LLTSAAGATPAADTTLTLTNPLDLAAGTQVKFYVVVDVKSTATLGHTLSFSIAPAKITLDSGNWPPSSETATWAPSGSTSIVNTTNITTNAVQQVGTATVGTGTNKFSVLKFTLTAAQADTLN